MKLTVEPLEGFRGFRLRGELDLATAPSLLEALADHDSTAESVALDVSGLEFVDSSGLHAFVSISAALENGAELLLVHPTPWLQRLLALTGLDRAPGIRVVREGEGPGAVARWASVRDSRS